MSLQLAAQHLSHQGRFGDSTLVHMSPVEVAALQKLAEKHGMSLTINPETGLPEAFSLKKLLPAIIGFGLNMFAPGIGSAIGSALGTSAAVGTGLAVGGFEALRTGDLGRGIAAGLGAYGGASLAGGVSAAAGSELAGSSAAVPIAENVAGSAVPGVEFYNPSNFAAADQLGAGIKGLGSEAGRSAFMQGMGGGKGLARAGYLSMIPSIMEQPKTKTEMPDIKQYMRSFDVDPTGRAIALTPFKLGSNPPGGKSGGLAAALAGGGAVAFADGGTTQKIQEWWKANEGKGDQAALDKWLATSGYSAAEIAKALPQFSVTDLNSAIASALTRQQVADRQETRGLYQAAHEKLFPGTDPGFVVTPHVDRPGNAYSKAILEEVQRMTAGQPAKTYGTTSAVPQEEIEAYKARLREKDPNLAEFMEWRLGEMDPMQHQRIGTLMAGKNPYDLDESQIAQFKATMERATQRAGGTPEWLQADWRKTQAARNAAYDAEQERRRKEAAGSGFVVGGGGGGGGTPNPNQPDPNRPDPTIPDPGRPDPTTPTPVNPVIPAPPPPPPYVRPDPFDPGKVPIDRLPTIEQKKPEDVMSGRSLEAYNALMGKGSTGTKVWQTSPMQPYYPSSRTPYYIRRGENTISTSTPISGSINFKDPNNKPVIDPGPGMQWVWDNATTTWVARPVVTNVSNPDPNNPIFNPDTTNQFAANGGIMRSYADGGSTGEGPYFINRNGNIIAVGDIDKYTDPYNPPKEDPGPGMRWSWDYTKAMWIKVATNTGTAKDVNDIVGAGGAGSVDGFSPTTQGIQGDPDSITNGLVAAMIGQQDAAPVSSMGTAIGMATGNDSPGGTTGDGAVGDATAAAAVGTGEGGDNKKGGLIHRYAMGGLGSLGGYSDGGRLLRGPGDGVSDSIPATIADRRPARLADGEFVVPARIVSELGNGSTEAGARKLYAMMDRVQKARGKTTGKGRVAVNSRADKHLPA